MKKTLLALLLLLAPVLADTALGKVYVIHYDEARKVTLNLPEGYLARQNAILCPWNEYFLVTSSALPPSTGKPVQGEADLSVELEQLARAHQKEGMQITQRQVWSTSKGPMARLALAGKVDGKPTAGTELILPVGAEIWIITLAGDASSEADQLVIQKLLIEELCR